MKNLIFLSLTSFFFFQSLNAQSFQKGGTYVSIGLGGSHFLNISPGNNYFAGVYSPITGQFSVQAEWGIHKYVGLGLTTGIGGGAGIGRFGLFTTAAPQMNIPIGIISNFHFYQLIADKTGKDIKADKLDVYAGLNLGTGVGLFFPGTGVEPTALVFAGPQVGVRYFFNDKMAVNGEVGYGKTWINAGLTFKL